MVGAAAPLRASRVWWSAVRPATLAASVAPVLAGTAIAVHEGDWRWAAGLAALVVALGMQVGVNFANDYSDFVRGADNRRVGRSGGRRSPPSASPPCLGSDSAWPSTGGC